jgi:hypothetical protein
MKPNFFVIGAPKCGTTSLSAWLATHPEIYMSPVKEPSYFCSDIGQDIIDLSSYEKLFNGATSLHKAVGEASPQYLFSSVAIPEIESYTLSSSRYIVCLRNPIEMAPSLWSEAVFGGGETVTNFERAWELQGSRAQGHNLPPFCQYPVGLQYGQWCSLGTQLERLYSWVPHDRILPILLDDVRSDARREYRRVLNFLKIEDDGRTEFPALNRAKVSRYPSFVRALQILGSVKGKLGIKQRFGLLRPFYELHRKHNLVRQPLPGISNEIRCTLRKYFQNEIQKMELLLERDLSDWFRY